MDRRAVIRNLVLGALVTGLGPLAGGGVDPAAAGESPEVLCRSTFGESGPVGGPVSGVGPSGDPMKTTIGWDPYDWSDGISEIVTCVSVGGRAAPAFTTSVPAPRNDGSLVVTVTLPPGEPGSLVCEQSILVGSGTTAGRNRTTSPVCFKLRATDAPTGPGNPAMGGAAPSAPAPAVPAAPAPAVPATPNPAPSADAPAPRLASTPPARAASAAPRSGTGFSATRPGVPDPVAGVAAPAPAWPDPASPVTDVEAGRSVRAAAAPASSPAPTPGSPPAAPVSTLARTGIDEHIPLASAGGFLAIGGAAIIFGAPGGRRRRPVRRPA